VHGVGGHPWETWAFDCAETSESTACTAFWPSDVLPTDCPDVRVMTWGYNADLSDEGHVPERLFSANAKLFLNQLDRLRPLGRGIVLVAHSLGGILIKEVCPRSATNDL
jgi:protein SERAC1